MTIMLIGLAGCGVPKEEGTAARITQVPYDLLKPEPSETVGPSVGATTRPFVYFVRDQGLVAVETSGGAASASAQGAVNAVLGQLAQGPSGPERSAGLTTALGPDARLRLVGLDGGLARVDLATGDQVPAAARVPLAIGQIVLSVCSVPGVDSVLITRDRAAVELPLPGGALSSMPVRALDYAPLIAKNRTTATR